MNSHKNTLGSHTCKEMYTRGQEWSSVNCQSSLAPGVNPEGDAEGRKWLTFQARGQALPSSIHFFVKTGKLEYKGSIRLYEFATASNETVRDKSDGARLFFVWSWVNKIDRKNVTSLKRSKQDFEWGKWGKVAGGGAGGAVWRVSRSIVGARASIFVLGRHLLQSNMVKSAYEPSGPSGRSLSRFQWHEATRSISTPPWMGC